MIVDDKIVWHILPVFQNNGKTDSGQPVIRDSTENQKEQTEPLIFNSSGTVGDGYNTDNPQNVLFNPTVYKCVLWFILWGLFIELGFGAVYFILSISVILYKNMRSGSRESSELSAYSVFNPNCERIDGTFTAEQFEKELRFGAGSVHWNFIRQLFVFIGFRWLLWHFTFCKRLVVSWCV